MKCQKCGQNEATVYYKETLNGQTHESHLCAQCAAEKNPSMFSSHFFSGSLFGNPLSKPQTEDKTCPTCGLTLTNLCKSGKVGCADCYSAFEHVLLPYIKKTHGAAKHISAKQNTAKPDENPAETLRKQLQEAVSCEDYETAAKLRDEIRRLEGEQ